MKKLFSMALVVLTAALVNSVFAFAKYVDITTTYTGGDVTDFPVLVKITTTTPTGFYSDVKNAGADLKFTDASGAGDYPYEIDTWNASGDSYIWVKLPKLSAGMTFRMYYGDEEQTQPTNPATAVWTGYDLVCHVNSNTDDTAAKDSSVNNLAGKLNAEAVLRNDGMVGAAYGMTVNNKGAAFANKMYNGGGKGGALDNVRFSYSFWVRRTAAMTQWQVFLGPKGAENSNAWGMSASTTDGSKMRVWATNKAYEFVNSAGMPVDEWRKFDIVHDDATISVYVNGTAVASISAESPRRDWIDWVGWGGSTNNNNPPFGNQSEPCDFDECRFRASVPDATRVAADYQTVANVATFLEFGDPQGGGPTVQVLPQGVIVK